jgi:hypothetical protein
VAAIQLDHRFEKWVQETAVKGFEQIGIKVTPSARLGLA